MIDENKILKQLGLNIKAERVRKGLTQENLAEIMDVSREYISTIERGLENMSMRKIVQMANRLGVEIHDLLKF